MVVNIYFTVELREDAVLFVEVLCVCRFRVIKVFQGAVKLIQYSLFTKNAPKLQ